MTDQLVSHYTRVREELVARRAELLESVSAEFLERMVRGLGHWVDAGRQGYLAWGILHFRAA
jgi:sarcosine/dimethylglycine N-methyltransferase